MDGENQNQTRFTVVENRRITKAHPQVTWDVAGVAFKGKFITLPFIRREAAEDHARRCNERGERPFDQSRIHPPVAGLRIERRTLYVPCPELCKIGKGRYTFVLPNGKHLTFFIGQDEEFSIRRQNHWEEIGVLLQDKAEAAIWLDRLTAEKFSEVKAALEGINLDWRSAARTYALESENCWRCGKELTEPTSIARCMGPDCFEWLISGENKYYNQSEKIALRDWFAQHDATMPIQPEPPIGARS
jgi:Family of unknown function (DUF6011)